MIRWESCVTITLHIRTRQSSSLFNTASLAQTVAVGACHCWWVYTALCPSRCQTSIFVSGLSRFINTHKSGDIHTAAVPFSKELRVCVCDPKWHKLKLYLLLRYPGWRSEGWWSRSFPVSSSHFHPQFLKKKKTQIKKTNSGSIHIQSLEFKSCKFNRDPYSLTSAFPC